MYVMCTLVMLMRKRHLAANFLFNGSLIYAITSALILECNGLSFVRGEGVVSRKIHLKSKLLPPRMSESLPSFNFCEWSECVMDIIHTLASSGLS